ncbi:MAG: phosphocholine cytidylyltransferase family protein [Candidatus Helarchaeota archaeon]
MENSVSAVILVAGMGKRLKEIAESTPKCLIDVCGKTILERQLETISAFGKVSKVYLVVGFLESKVKEFIFRNSLDNKYNLEFTFVKNKEFSNTNTAYSLWLTKSQLNNSNIVYFNGDVVIKKSILNELVSDEGSRLAIIKGDCGDEEVKVSVNKYGKITRIGKKIPRDKAIGEFIGVAFFDKTTTSMMFNELDNFNWNDEVFRNAYFEEALDRLLLENAITLRSHYISNKEAIEIDFPEDLRRARNEIVNYIE